MVNNKATNYYSLATNTVPKSQCHHAPGKGTREGWTEGIQALDGTGSQPGEDVGCQETPNSISHSGTYLVVLASLNKFQFSKYMITIFLCRYMKGYKPSSLQLQRKSKASLLGPSCAKELQVKVGELCKLQILALKSGMGSQLLYF